MGAKPRPASVALVFKRVHRAHGYGAVKRRPREPEAARDAILRLADIDARCGEDDDTILHEVVQYHSREEQSDATSNKGNRSAGEIAQRRAMGRQLVALILAQGASVDMPNKYGRTALQLAASADPAIIELLLAAGANPNTADMYGVTPLLACCMQKSVRKKNLELLLAAGADPTATINGRTAAVMLPKKHQDLASLLGGKQVASPRPSENPAKDARAGNLEALQALADGDPATDNDRLAYKWLCVAADFGHAGASALAEDLLESSSLHADDDGFEQGQAHGELAVAYRDGSDGLLADPARAAKHLAIARRLLGAELDRLVNP